MNHRNENNLIRSIPLVQKRFHKAIKMLAKYSLLEAKAIRGCKKWEKIVKYYVKKTVR